MQRLAFVLMVLKTACFYQILQPLGKEFLTEVGLSTHKRMQAQVKIVKVQIMEDFVLQVQLPILVMVLLLLEV